MRAGLIERTSCWLQAASASAECTSESKGTKSGIGVEIQGSGERALSAEGSTGAGENAVLIALRSVPDLLGLIGSARSQECEHARVRRS